MSSARAPSAPSARARPPTQAALHAERWALLRRLDRGLDRPLTVLSVVWLGLLVLELGTGQLPPPLDALVFAIWAVFIVDFVLGLVIAPDRLVYVRRRWLSAIALVLPALRVLRVLGALRLLRVARVARIARSGTLLRSATLLRLVTSANRGFDTAARILGRRGIGYLLAATLVVLFLGAAGMASFESPAALRAAGVPATGATGAAGAVGAVGAGLANYGEALWWTAMMLTTIGTGYTPVTVEGRILGFLIAIWAIAVFGYLVATLASHFVGTERPVADEG